LRFIELRTALQRFVQQFVGPRLRRGNRFFLPLFSPRNYSLVVGRHRTGLIRKIRVICQGTERLDLIVDEAGAAIPVGVEDVRGWIDRRIPNNQPRSVRVGGDGV
jgi:hypothetical protein